MLIDKRQVEKPGNSSRYKEKRESPTLVIPVLVILGILQKISRDYRQKNAVAE